MSRHVSKGIVLARENFGEADQYVQFFTLKWGMITVLAKSARKSKRRYIGGLDIFCHDEIFLRGDPKERGYLVELSVLNSFPELRDDLDRMLSAGKIVQWVRKLADVASPNPAVYSVLGQTLSLIEKETRPERLGLLELIFKLKLLSAVGLKPRMEGCVQCGDNSTPEVLFDISAGGVLCRKCLTGDSVTGGYRLAREERTFLAGADRFRLTSWDTLTFPQNQSSHLSRLLTQFASFHTHARLPV